MATHGYGSSNDKTVINKNELSSRTIYRIEVVKFTNDTYLSLNDIIITSSSDKKEWCALKGNIQILNKESVSGESSGINSTNSPTANV